MRLQLLVRRAAELRIETPRLVLRRVAERDRATLAAHEEDRGIMQWIRDPVPARETDERTDRMVEPYTGADGQWLALALVDRGDPRDLLQGLVCVRLTAAADETMELGYRLHGAVHRRGYAFEACSALFDLLFGEVELHRIVAMCVTDNEPSWRLMEKLGMQREGRLREYKRLGGAWRDEFVYGILRGDWRPGGRIS